MQSPGIIIAGTGSGCGKTTISLGIMAALAKRNMKVQPFKVGPDYIDPMFHTFITAKESRNLDSWLLSEEVVRYLYNRKAVDADISIIEGVMGFYDGFGGYDESGSTAHVSKILKTPVILIIEASGMAQSAAAIINGFINFDKDVNIAGVIFNKVNSKQHFELLEEIVEKSCGIKVIGYLPSNSEYLLKSRHLGLIPSGEIADLNLCISKLVDQIESTINLDLIVKISKLASPISNTKILLDKSSTQSKVIIGIAKDKAFNFYYKDNIDLLEYLGAEIVEFSPLKDSKLLKNISGIYIGGGYPEMFARELSENVSMKNSIRNAIFSGMPVYAECGGLMYLSDSIKTKEGDTFEMVGALKGTSEMTGSLKRFGYVEVEVQCDNVLAKQGQKIRAHEFHFSKFSLTNKETNASFKVTKNRRAGKSEQWECGFTFYNTVASYPHLHFWSNIAFAERFIKNVEKYNLQIN